MRLERSQSIYQLFGSSRTAVNLKSHQGPPCADLGLGVRVTGTRRTRHRRVGAQARLLGHGLCGSGCHSYRQVQAIPASRRHPCSQGLTFMLRPGLRLFRISSLAQQLAAAAPSLPMSSMSKRRANGQFTGTGSHRVRFTSLCGVCARAMASAQ